MQARKDAQEWRNCNASDIIMPPGRRASSDRGYQSHKNWRRTERGWVKCNVDGSFVRGQRLSKAGWMIRDSDGFYMGAGQSVGREVINPLESELQGIIMGLQHC